MANVVPDQVARSFIAAATIDGSLEVGSHRGASRTRKQFYATAMARVLSVLPPVP